ncbi:hypothetical protein OLX02_15185 [Novosphingobium sp. KCTC 2891]|uniref:hypothetical protein n=1 Tax=Novosphingobium sp. KCTC 2891 TaxID=2989730 RepID=UPI002222A27D|nr:hypothetical protein [Novosphingobium sp. KCTC 2891]MCW1384166.1 hypothetical protein [Novosphingobium sp. KCTC 2891]
MPFANRPALMIATLALGGLFPMAAASAHRTAAACPDVPQPPLPPEPPAAPIPPAPPEPPEIDMSEMRREIDAGRQEAIAAIREARREVEHEAYMPTGVRARVLAELDAALRRVEREFARRHD